MPNSKQNQMCWNCNHFQRYDEVTIDSNQGECRKRQQPGKRKEQIAEAEFLFIEYWPYIDNGAVFWCGEWEIVDPALTIPAFNPSPRATDWQKDWDDFNLAAWNVKEDLNISCWTCNHFQAANIVNPQDDKGECRKMAPPPVTTINDTAVEGDLESIKLQINGLERWCGCWEQAIHPIPTIVPIP